MRNTSDIFNLSADVRPHGKRYHRHRDHTVLTPALWIFQRQGGKVRRIRIGRICIECGFIPNDAYKRAQLEAMEVMLGG